MNDRSDKRAIPFAALTVATLLLSGSAVAQSEDAGFSTVLDLGVDYDDNLTLAGGHGEKVVDDFSYRLQPQVRWLQQQRDNEFGVSAGADWRKGIDSDLDELNVDLGAHADMRHPSGWRVKLSDVFSRRSFDQALFFAGSSLAVAEPGVGKQIGNAAGAHVEFRPKERFMVGAGYDFQIDDFDFAKLLGNDRRRVHQVNGRIEVPVAASWFTYASGDYRLQDSRERKEFDYNDRRLVGGLKWQSPSEVEVYAEAGWQGIDFDDSAGREFDELVARLGFNAPVTEESTLFGSVGRNGYDDIDFTAGYERRWDDQGLRFTGRRSTENSFSTATLGRVFEATVVSAEFEKDLQVSWHWAADGSFFRQKSEGLASLENDTYQVGTRLLYDFRPMFAIGASYRFSRRNSNLADQEFEDSRVMVFIRLRHRTS